MKERDAGNESFWTIDEELCELPLLHSGEPTSYSVRIKAHLQHVTYQGNRELYPLQADQGTKIDLIARAYVLVPDITLTVDLRRDMLPSNLVGAEVKSSWRGMRHEELARLRGLYYVEDRALAIWEIDDVDRLDLAGRLTLWQGFERFLTHRYPDARRMYADDAEPGPSQADNQDFLRSLGYQDVASTPRFFAKELFAPHP